MMRLRQKHGSIILLRLIGYKNNEKARNDFYFAAGDLYAGSIACCCGVLGKGIVVDFVCHFCRGFDFND